jgi:carbamoyl-phosphate synthase large subunit
VATGDAVTGATLMISGIGKRNETLRLLVEECSRHQVDVIGADASPHAPARAEFHRFEQLLMADDDDFGRRYAQIVAENEVTALLTLVDPEVAAIGDLASNGELAGGTVLHPDAETARLCEDKFALHEKLAATGVAVVPTHLDALTTYPYIRKHRRGSRSSGFVVVGSPEDARPVDSAEYVYQPFRDGPHYCVDAYFSVHSGALVDFCVKEVLVKQHGESHLLRSVPRDQFIDLVHRVGQDIPLRGVVNFDVYGGDDGPTLMEINCRIGGNYPAAHAVGANLLRHLVGEVVAGEAKEDFSSYDVDMYVSKFIGFTAPYSWPPGA